MPVIAIGAAVIADVAATTAVSAVVAGAAISAATVFTVVAAVGATVGAIGAVTGDKNLQRFGMIVGAVGGIGALASSIGAIGGDAASLGNDADAAAGMGTGSDAYTAASGAASVSPLGSVTDPASDAANAAVPSVADGIDPTYGGVINSTDATGTDVSGLANGEPITQAMDGGAGPLVQPGDAALGPKPPAPGVTGGTSTTATGNPAATAAATPDNGVDQASNMLRNLDLQSDVAAEGGTGSGGIMGTLGKFGSSLTDYATAHPGAALGVLQAAGSFLQGATNGLTPAQIAAYNAQAAANRAAAALAQQQASNMAGNLPVASRVTGTPASTAPVPAGLINSTAKPAANVTGVPAS